MLNVMAGFLVIKLTIRILFTILLIQSISALHAGTIGFLESSHLMQGQ